MRMFDVASTHRIRKTRRINVLLVAAGALICAPGNYTSAADTGVSAAANAAVPPDGLLTEWEARRHAQFIGMARERAIRILFIGDSSVEFWLQEGEGREEWQRTYVPKGAANFGVQGADIKSVMWRLQNGELDGFEAEVIVVDGMWAGASNDGASDAEVLEANAAVVAEIRKRQPQADVLLLVVPGTRYAGGGGGGLETALTEKFASFADGDRIHFVDTRPVFLKPDGSLDTMILSGRGSAMNAHGYGMLSRAIQPKIAELMSGS